MTEKYYKCSTRIPACIDTVIYFAYYVADICLCFKDHVHYFMDVVVGPEQAQSGLAAEENLSPGLRMIDMVLLDVSTLGK